MKDKIALITEDSRGIGLVTADLLAGDGAEVIILHSGKMVRSDTKEIIANISGEAQVRDAVDSVVRDFSWVDVLVNNAGIAIDKEWYARTVADFRRTLDINLIGTWLMTKYVGAVMMENKYGKIANVSSTSEQRTFRP
jgi:3-oxoacyl-[acyl-carrier protein] reductase